MALHPNFPDDPHAILDPAIRWFPAADSPLLTSGVGGDLPVYIGAKGRSPSP